MTKRQEKIKQLKRECSNLRMYYRKIDSEQRQLTRRLISINNRLCTKLTRLVNLEQDEYWSKPKMKKRMKDFDEHSITTKK